MRCYLCLGEGQPNYNFLCQNCFINIKKLYWTNCAGCGADGCYGCENLIEFENIFSIMVYSFGIPEILVLAKDRGDYNAQLLFYNMFFNITVNYLREIFLKEDYNYIVFPVCRRERILTSNWHPLVFFEEVFKKLKAEFISTQKNFNILRPLYIQK